MPPGGHYRQQLSNPYNNYAQSQSQFQNHNAPFNTHNFGNQGGFPVSQPNQHNIGLFGGGLANGGAPNSFGGNAVAPTGAAGLASQEAQMRFAQGAAMQQQETAITTSRNGGAMAGRIREVYRNNMEQEFAMIRSLVDKYPYISMDTEFPGIVARPMGEFKSKSDYHYQTLRANVDLLKLIQLGITLWSAEGELPPANTEVPMQRGAYPNNLMMCPCSWMFNFKFSEEDDMSSEESITMLKKAGIDFDKCATIGIEPKDFGARLVDSGLVCQPGINWLSFHSGYDFGYLTKVMYPVSMPESEEDYVKIIQLYFGRIYDVKFLLRMAQNNMKLGRLTTRATEVISSLGMKSGLQDLANELGCTREGKAHTAGSDSLLTGSVFWAIREQIFNNDIPEDHVNQIWGLSQVGPPASASSQAAAMSSQTPGQNGASLYNSAMTPSTYTESNNARPSTPQNHQKGLASTPGPHGQNYSGGMGAGGAFSSFLYGRG